MSMTQNQDIFTKRQFEIEFYIMPSFGFCILFLINILFTIPTHVGLAREHIVRSLD